VGFAGFRRGVAVEYLGPEGAPQAPEGWLRHGHPGRVTDGSPQDVFVDWFGLEEQDVSRRMSYDLPSLHEISEQEYGRRVDRVRRGLPPITGEN